MEFPEPYHSLPIRDWRKQMKAYPDDYATIGALGRSHRRFSKFFSTTRLFKHIRVRNAQ
jgi:hypothetical protein